MEEKDKKDLPITSEEQEKRTFRRQMKWLVFFGAVTAASAFTATMFYLITSLA